VFRDFGSCMGRTSFAAEIPKHRGIPPGRDTWRDKGIPGGIRQTVNCELSTVNCIPFGAAGRRELWELGRTRSSRRRPISRGKMLWTAFHAEASSRGEIRFGARRLPKHLSPAALLLRCAPCFHERGARDSVSRLAGRLFVGLCLKPDKMYGRILCCAAQPPFFRGPMSDVRGQKPEG